MTAVRIAAAVLAGALLAGCATTAVRAPLPAAVQAAAEARQAGREAALARQPQWSLQGRVALSNGRQGGSGRLDWTQDGDRYAVALSAPITRQSWRLVGAPGTAELQGLEGGPRGGSDPAEVLRTATGWEIPVAALVDWVRGAPASAGGPARLSYGADGRLRQLAQAGWTIDYDDWSAPAGFAMELPGRLTARRDRAQVRLVVDQWTPAAAAP